ncbi:MAG: ATPase, partial [Nanohaloarchaea archaeon SW_7_46_7]
IGRVELGMIPQICDTVVFIKDAQIEEVYKLELVVKVPQGMTEEDLARPVIQISRFEDDAPQYEVYTYGEETVVVPVTDSEEETGAQRLAREKLQQQLGSRVDDPVIEFISDNHIRLMVSEDEISHVIGKGGENIDRLEDELGLDITVEPNTPTSKGEISFELSEKGNSVIIDVGEEKSGTEVDIYEGDEFLFKATVGKSGDISLTKKSELANRVIGANESGRLKVRA